MTGVAEYIESQRAIIEREGFVLPKTSGSSMRPLIWGEDHCVVVVPLVGEPAVGDILMFRQSLDGRNIVHRVVAVEGDAARRVYIARGDNCLGCERVTRDQIIGRVAEAHRLSGYRPWHAIPKKKFTVTDPAYSRYVRLWTLLWPLRRLWYHLRLRLPKH